MTQHAIAYRVAAAAAALVLLTACGDDDDDTKASDSSSTVDQPLSTPAGSASASESDEPSSTSAKETTVEFDAEEFKFDLSTTTFKAGDYVFRVMNVGKTPHALQIDGPGVEDATTGTIPAGGEGEVTVTLKKGTYHFYCPVGDHESRGMENEITVT